MLPERSELFRKVTARRWPETWFLAWAIASSAVLISAATRLGPTFDEPVYLKSGLSVWETWNHKALVVGRILPLPIDVGSLPVWLLNPQDPFRVARVGTLGFWWLLLFAAGRLAEFYFTPWGGRWAVALVASEPVLLGHASLFTTDIPFTACLLSAVWCYRSGSDAASWWRSLVWPGVAAAAALLSKASALLYLPVCIAVLEVDRLSNLLCHTNALAGGTAAGYRALSDSNSDWGQGVPELAAWHAEHGRPPPSAWAFGNDPTIGDFAGPVWVNQVVTAGDLRQLGTGYFLAVGTSVSFGY